MTTRQSVIDYLAVLTDTELDELLTEAVPVLAPTLTTKKTGVDAGNAEADRRFGVTKG